MTQLQVDPTLQQKLGDAAQPIVICDASGKVIGHFLPEEYYKDLLYASYQLPLSDEELARRREEVGGCTLQEIWQKLDRK
jgi:hypothetical protein